MEGVKPRGVVVGGCVARPENSDNGGGDVVIAGILQANCGDGECRQIAVMVSVGRRGT